MNCQAIAYILDNRDIRALEADERAAARAHVDACADCTRTWRAHALLVERPMAPMPPAVPDRLWQAFGAARM